MGELICPNCGSKVKLPEHSEVCMGTTFSKESNGTHYLQMENNSVDKKENKNMTRNEERLATLKANGVDVSKYFNVTLPTGGEMIMTMKNGVPTPVNDSELDKIRDEIREQIIEDGYVRNTKLHRRFVMAQMFRMLGNCDGYGDDYNQSLDRLGYKYQYTMMLEELRIQTKLFTRDEKSFKDRNSFFNQYVAYHMAMDFAEDARRHFRNFKTKNCKGIPYIRFRGTNIFCADIEKKLIAKIERLATDIKYSQNPSQLYVYFERLVKLVKTYNIKWNTPQCESWRDAYKGAGAYYTLRNMVMYHNCKLNVYRTSDYVTGTEAIEYLESRIDEYDAEGWRFMAMLRKCIADNDFKFRY